MSDTSHLRSTLVMGASVVAIAAMAAPAMAQTGGAQAAPGNQGNEANVVVIAQHQTVKLQKIPVAVSVFTSATRDRTGIATVQDVTNFAPGFVYSTVTVNAGMRGVTRQSFNVTDDSRVAAYEDEFFVYSPYNLGESSLFNSQEQIQRGPQNVGGRNSEGGSIDMIAWCVRRIIPTQRWSATIANFGSYDVEGAASNGDRARARRARRRGLERPDPGLLQERRRRFDGRRQDRTVAGSRRYRMEAELQL